MKAHSFGICCFLSAVFRIGDAFVASTSLQRPTKNLISRRYNFFKDLVDKAFENDVNLSPDKTQGQYDAPGEEYADSHTQQQRQLTETQRQWRERNQQASAPQIVGTSWKLDLFLSGVPSKDPNNDLYGSRINISNRDKSTGLLSLPDKPSTSATITFLDDGVVQPSAETEFVTKQEGEWKLSEDQNQVRFCIECLGYTRRVETRGSIQSVYWSEEGDQAIETSTTYDIPSGWIYADLPVTTNARGKIELGPGVLKVQQSSGFFGAASKLVPCGKVRPLQVDE